MFLQQIINGITQGGIYALVAVGYTLIFGVLDIINMAHGDVFMIGGLVGYYLITYGKMGLVPALLGAMLGSALIGLLLEFTALRPLRKKGVSFLAPLISTIGFSMVLQNSMIQVAGAQSLSLRVPLADGLFHLGPLAFSTTELVVLGTSVVLMLLLQWALTKTKLGRAARALAENQETAALLGVNVSASVTAVVMAASALGGAAGVLVGISFVSVQATMGLTYGLQGLAVIILGGLGSVQGAVAGGVIIGILQSLTAAYLNAGYRDVVTFGFLFLVLILRPQGLFGQSSAATRRS